LITAGIIGINKKELEKLWSKVKRFTGCDKKKMPSRKTTNQNVR
jgi:hypothetical protein